MREDLVAEITELLLEKLGPKIVPGEAETLAEAIVMYIMSQVTERLYE